MTTEELVAEMGEPIEIRSFKDEKQVWIDGDFNTEKHIVYHIGYDNVYIFDYQNKYCLWKAYIKDNKVIYINLSSRYTEKIYTDNVTIRNTLHYHCSIENVERVLGKDFFPDRHISFTDYFYAELGIRLTFIQGKMTNIYMFRRFTNRADLYRLVKYYPKDK